MSTTPMRLVSAPLIERQAGTHDHAGAIVHDIGNLLQVLSCTIGAIERAVDRGDADLSGFIKRARTTLDKAGNLTRRIVDTGATSARRVSLAQTLKASSETFRAAAGPMVDVRVDVDADAPDILCDPINLERILLNLVVNARDAMPDGGRLRIAARRGPFPPGSAGDMLILSVIDTGCGMPDEVRKRACEPRFTTKPAGHGSGVGLATVKAFAHQHDGSLHLESAPGRGTKVSLLIPGHARKKPVPARLERLPAHLPYMAA